MIALALVLLPALGALLVAALPRAAAILQPLLCALWAALSVLLAMAEPEPGIVAADVLNLPFVLAVAFGALLLSLMPVPAEDRPWHAGVQAMLGGAMLSMLGQNMTLSWLGLEVALLGAMLPLALAAPRAGWKLFLLGGVGLGLTLFGLVAVHVAAPEALLHWPALQARGIETMDPMLLALGFVLALAGCGALLSLAPFHAWWPDTAGEAPSRIAALFPLLLAPSALHMLLRIKALAGGNMSAWSLLALGVGTMLLASLSLYRKRDAGRMLGLASMLQLGAAAAGFGLGGPAGNLAGLLILLGHGLGAAAGWVALGAAMRLKDSRRLGGISGLMAGSPGLGWALMLALLALACLPPFLPFAGAFLLLTSAGRQAPWLMPPLLLALLLGAAALARAAQRLCMGPATADAEAPPGWRVLAPAWAALALALLGALAMPGPFAALLAAAAEAAR
ncbi:hypothetical protein EOD42_09340 [Rhodovarius crocodyli]|uniref:NADH:quinone oxidoreductase/Mrp antiporter transmembrane domain-containing protein n=1 Tax=Rhodovarius crocodyli TaxID=1979269 RepID=A0A437MG26_9PROT|nr:proton-conducting transporter membrane subunit [Rhodovarius crocodyli]RVT96613.1 hypothetical protein EOD42_09340 [Rhodovarius crocodyli]